jgi:adenylate cyclase
MGIEIERKFRVTGEGWRNAARQYFCQGYLNRDKHRTVRVRVRVADEQAFLTIKGLTTGASRVEFEYSIPVADARALLLLCDGALIEKYRYLSHHAGMCWEVDEFLGDNQGLVIAEIELQSETQSFVRPDWLGEEVTQDARYYNANLVDQPYKLWGTPAHGPTR